MARFIQLLRAERPTIFHAHLNWPLGCQHALLCALVARTPVVVTTTHIANDALAGRSLWLRRWMNRRIDHSIAVSHGVAEYLRAQIGIAPAQVTVIHNGVDEPDQRPRSSSAPCSDSSTDPDHVNVLTIARLVPQKGLDYLLEAARLLPSARFAIAGDGPERRYLEARLRALSLDERVCLLGHREDVACLLARADVCVLPSLYEGLPLVLLEALMQGTPVIATDIAGVDEVIVSGENGLLVPASNPVALAQAIERVLADRSLARRLGERGRQSARQHFSAARMLAQYEALYHTLVTPDG
jgi:glycosyltransferase involved in cell wall biosynthesis